VEPDRLPWHCESYGRTGAFLNQRQVFPSGLYVDPSLDKAPTDFKPMSDKDAENNKIYDAELMAGSPISFQVCFPCLRAAGNSYGVNAAHLEEVQRVSAMAAKQAATKRAAQSSFGLGAEDHRGHHQVVKYLSCEDFKEGGIGKRLYFSDGDKTGMAKEAGFLDSLSTKWFEWTGYGVREEDKPALLEKRQIARCEKWLAELRSASPVVRFLQQHTALLSPSAADVPIVCHPCDGLQAGGFSDELGAILICTNGVYSKAHMEDTIAHELVHAFDQRRFKVNFGNLRHLACSEASSALQYVVCLRCRKDSSGQLERRLPLYASVGRHGLVRRLLSGLSDVPLDGYAHVTGQKCVRRRAVESVLMSPNCPNREAAERAVNEVWQSCWPDTRPFDEVGCFLDTSSSRINVRR
jgi:inner membrane protease ATP23